MNIRKPVRMTWTRDYIWKNQRKCGPFSPDIHILINWKVIICFSVLILFISCKSSFYYSYEEEDGPFYEGDYGSLQNEKERGTEIKVVSYNIEFANNFKGAIDILSSGDLADFDVLLLQEMDEVATDAVAKALNCNYIYYPSINHPGQGKLVGNAILSKWPIRGHSKVLLPHPSIYPVITELKTYKFRKIATVALIEINGVNVKFYCTHGAAFNTSKARRSLAGKIANEVQLSEADYVVVGGDFNTVGYGDILSTVEPFESKGMIWATENIGRTIGHIRWMISFFPAQAFQSDHIFVKGFEIIDMGKIENTTISDHFPIWIKLKNKE